MRGKVARLGLPWSQPGQYKARDIRQFFAAKPRAVVQAGGMEPIAEEGKTAFAGKEASRSGKKRKLSNGGRKRREVSQGLGSNQVSPGPRLQEVRMKEPAPPVDEVRKVDGLKEEDILRTPRKALSAISGSGRKRPRQEGLLDSSKKARLCAVKGGVKDDEGLVRKTILKFEEGGGRYWRGGSKLA